MTFWYLKTLVFDKFFYKLLQYLIFLFWRVLLVITNPLLYDYWKSPPPYTLIPLFISGKLIWLKKILELFSTDPPPPLFRGDWCHDTSSFAELLEKDNVRTVYNKTETSTFLGPRIWEIVPDYIKKSSNFEEFKLKIKLWNPENSACKLCKGSYRLIFYNMPFTFFMQHILSYFIHILIFFINQF